MLMFETDIMEISRVGQSAARLLKKLDIKTALDLLFYFPFRYDDFTRLVPLAELRAGMSANVIGRIELMQNKRSPRRRLNITEALVSDGTATLKVIWFNQPFIARVLRVGDKVSLAGKIDDDYGGLVMMSPVYEKVNLTPALSFARRGSDKAIHTQGLVPNYHLTAKLTQKQVRFLIKQVINLSARVVDWLPAEIRRAVKLVNLAAALKKIHFPENNSDIKQAHERLAFDELFLIQLQAQLVRKNLSASRAPAIKFHEPETKKFVSSLPFKLTVAQRKAAWEILRDLAKDKPMSRLLEGDVGSGKTMVAIIAMLNTALNDRQAVLMAPTEILAKQHYDTICQLLNNFNIKIGLITRSDKRANYQLPITNYQLNANAKNNKISSSFVIDSSDIIIGTHALIQENVKFNNLALAVVDEQHRFGVEQRKRLLEKTSPQPSPSKGEGEKLSPHLLSMTATPIPRSLALALYGDLDLSIINEMPKERKKIITKVVPEESRVPTYEFIRAQVRAGRQVFVICPLIDMSDKLGIKSVEAEYEKLNKIIFPDLVIGKLHGRLRPEDKEKIMREFLDNKIKILVATSVVEVGLDAPNASVMMIEGADRFGLAQSHQFRGRVGRSIYQSYCFLFTDSRSPVALDRLKALTDCADGFELAKLDLKFRGPGQVYGFEQKGFPELKIASLFDYGLMKQAREQAVRLVKEDASLSGWPALKEKLGQWKRQVHLE